MIDDVEVVEHLSAVQYFNKTVKYYLHSAGDADPDVRRRRAEVLDGGSPRRHESTQGGGGALCQPMLHPAPGPGDELRRLPARVLSRTAGCSRTCQG